MVTRKLKYCPYGQASIIESNDGSLALQSYSTIMCSYNPAQGVLTKHSGYYSNTTAKHLNAFFREIHEIYGVSVSYYIHKGMEVNESLTL